MSHKNSNRLYLVALVLFLGGLGYLAVSSFYLNSKPWTSVSQILERLPDKPQAIRVFGSVQSDGLVMLKEGAGARFQIMDIDNTQKRIWVDYAGVVPDTFEAGVEVIVDGTYSGPDNDVVSTKLLTKCPSKYEKSNRELTAENRG